LSKDRPSGSFPGREEGVAPMTIPYERPETLTKALEDAHTLVDLGVPVFGGRLTADGDPDAKDLRWKSWQKTRANHRPIDRFAKGDALGAVTGIVFDVIDVDPRSGGHFSFKKLSEDLGDEGPEVYWEVRTSSGGKHVYIAPLGMGTHPGFMPGLDLKAGGGFVFIPPTIRPSKAEKDAGRRMSYRAMTELAAPVGDGYTGPIIEYITERLAAKRGNKHGSIAGGRQELSKLEQDCLQAISGEQHEALRALVDELARTNGDDEYVFFRAWTIAQQMTLFDRRWPWTEQDVRGLLHRPERRPVPDATKEEMEILKGTDGPISPRVKPAGLESFDDVEDKLTRWGWLRYLPLGDAVILDGDAGLAKSLITLDVVGRATTARAMPEETEVLIPKLNALILAPEDRKEVIKARLKAAGADLKRCFFPAIQLKGKGKNAKATFGGQLMCFPDRIDQFRTWIRSYDIGIVIVDPIAAFLAESVNSSNDASVRRALEPFAMVLGEAQATALMIRHLNKQVGNKASFRGGGSVAFGAVARVHLIAGELPPGVGEDGAKYAIAQLKNSHLQRTPGTALGYVVEDSDIVADEDGNMVPRIRWCGKVDIDADVLANGEPRRRGPEPTSQGMIREMLQEMFDEKDTWPAGKVKTTLAEAGYKDHKTNDKVRSQMGIRSVRVMKRGAAGVQMWVWTTAKEKVGADD
jgi:hypothetical protein